jgi:hypothetical protein
MGLVEHFFFLVLLHYTPHRQPSRSIIHTELELSELYCDILINFEHMPSICIRQFSIRQMKWHNCNCISNEERN